MLQERYEEATQRYLDSEQLDPAPGTLLNIAYCYEKLGRTATAWALYRQAAAMAGETGRSDWSEHAQERVASLEETLIRVAIRTRSDAAADGIHISLDGAPLPENAWGERVPLRPGVHEIRAEATARETWTLTFQVDAEHLPAIAVPDLSRPPPPPPQTLVTSKPAVHPAPIRPSHEGSAGRTMAIALGGAGLATLAVAAGLTLAAKSTNDGVHCPGDVNCTPRQVEANSRAYAEAGAATATAVTGGLAVVCAAALWFAFPPRSARAQPAELAVVPSAEAALVGVSVREIW
jgi:hypothetical protein